MDPNAQNQTTKPMNEPHIPISQREMQNEPSHGSNKNTILTILSLVILISILGVTLYLYLFNRSSNSNTTTQETNSYEESTNEKSIGQTGAISPVVTPSCKRETSIESALRNPEVVCVLDLSNESLTQLPDGIDKLTGLFQLDISNNRLENLPNSIFTLKKLISLNASNNQISEIPDEVSNLTMLQTLNASNNNLAELPGSLSTMRNLTLLKLKANKFSNEEEAKIKSVLTNIKVIDF